MSTTVKAPFHDYSETSEEDASHSPHRHETAQLRRDNSLSPPELAFLDARKKRIVTSESLATFLGLENGTEVDERDVPIVRQLTMLPSPSADRDREYSQIGLGGSGGGMRANL